MNIDVCIMHIMYMNIDHTHFRPCASRNIRTWCYVNKLDNWALCTEKQNKKQKCTCCIYFKIELSNKYRYMYLEILDKPAVTHEPYVGVTLWVMSPIYDSCLLFMRHLPGVRVQGFITLLLCYERLKGSTKSKQFKGQRQICWRNSCHREGGTIFSLAVSWRRSTVSESGTR